MRFNYTDFHVHTYWSHDIATNGPSFEEYTIIAEKGKINVCFLDHYEFFYIEHDKNYPFYGGKIEQYLEEIDTLKESYDFVLSGLEVDYYKEYENKLREFMDNYSSQFDFIAGTIHETDLGLPVTTRDLLLKLLTKRKMKDIVDHFFDLTKEMINSKIFQNVCHLDTIFRYINERDLKPTLDTDTSDDRVLELGKLCVKNNIGIEYNLSGLNFPIGRTFPSKSVIIHLKKNGAKIFIGSDSHSIKSFQMNIKRVKKAYKFLNQTK